MRQCFYDFIYHLSQWNHCPVHCSHSNEEKKKYALSYCLVMKQCLRCETKVKRYYIYLILCRVRNSIPVERWKVNHYHQPTKSKMEDRSKKKKLKCVCIYTCSFTPTWPEKKMSIFRSCFDLHAKRTQIKRMCIHKQLNDFLTFFALLIWRSAFSARVHVVVSHCHFYFVVGQSSESFVHSVSHPAHLLRWIIASKWAC